MSLVFDWRIFKGRRHRTDSRFRSRVLTTGVTPSIHVECKHSKIEQYHKEGVALRTEAAINDTRDFGVGRRLHNLPELRQIGFCANRRLLDVQRISHEPIVATTSFAEINQPAIVDGQRAPTLRFGDPRVHALLAAIVVFHLLPAGFANHDLRAHLTPLLGLDPDSMTAHTMTYDLRRLRLHGLIERIPHTHRSRVTDQGLSCDSVAGSRSGSLPGHHRGPAVSGHDRVRSRCRGPSSRGGPSPARRRATVTMFGSSTQLVDDQLGDSVQGLFAGVVVDRRRHSDVEDANSDEHGSARVSSEP